MKFTLVKIASFIFLGFLLFSCENTDDSSTEISTIDINEIKSLVVSGSWMVASYKEDGIDQTSNFSGYGFTFNSEGVLGAANGSTSISGAWSIVSDSSSSNDDSSSNDNVDFNIFFTSPANFEEISEDWQIVSYSSSRIELKHVSGGDSSIDRLIFEKQ